MAKKTGFKFSYNAPFTLTFTFICVFVFLLDNYILKGYLNRTLLICKAGKAEIPFDFKAVKDYFALILHVFAETDISAMFINLMFMNILAVPLEEKYGGPVLLLMASITTLISGVLTACIGFTSLSGYLSIILLLIFLSSLNAFQKKQIQLSWVLVILAFILRDILATSPTNTELSITARLVSAIINLIAGLAGSLFGFLSVPSNTTSKPKKTKRKTTKTTTNTSPEESDATIVSTDL